MDTRIFRRRFAVFACSSALLGAVAWACADGGYETGFQPTDSVGLLSPGNDTRTNFVLLMADRNGTKVADPSRMKGAIVPYDMPYNSVAERLLPKQAGEQSNADADDGYGLSPNSNYRWSGENMGLCHSNGSGAAAFNAVLDADRSVPAAEKDMLKVARATLATSCDNAAELSFALASVTSPSGRAYANYLDGARLFYALDFAGAASRFNAINPSAPAWLAEAATYMRFRNALARATSANVDEYGSMLEASKRNPVVVRAADHLRQDYLKAYPKGLYANSARDLSRRVAWLANDRPALGAAYSAMLTSAPRIDGNLPNTDAMDEIDIKLFPTEDGAGVTDPALLAIIDLKRLRPAEMQYEGGNLRLREGAVLTRADLERQRPVFARDPDLYGFLLAAEAFYGRKQAREVLTLIPDAAHQPRFSYLQFSRQMLRGMALEAAKDRNARAFWLTLLPGATQPYQRAAVELALYQHDRSAGMIGRLLETGSPILHPLIRREMIEEDAGPDLLRQQASGGADQQQRDVALYLLLTNELHHGMYRQFLTDQTMVGTRGDKEGQWGWSVGSFDPTYTDQLNSPRLQDYWTASATGAGCAGIVATAQALSANPKAVRPQLCLAEFIRAKGYDGWNDSWDYATSKPLTKARNHFPGTPQNRAIIYRMVLANPAATPDDRAMALNRSIRCYQPSGYSSCGDEQPKSVRKVWFDELKRKYPASPWAKELKYYW